MFDWLYEGHATVYVLLIGLAVVSMGLWWRDRKRRWLLLSGCFLLLAGAYYGLSVVKDTARKQVPRRIDAMGRAVKAGDVDGIFRHISEKFRIGGQDRARFRRAVEKVIQDRMVDDVKVWDFELPEGVPD